MHKEGKDISTLLPSLSAYMGHSKYQHTLYYLHFLPEQFSEMSGFDLNGSQKSYRRCTKNDE